MICLALLSTSKGKTRILKNKTHILLQSSAPDSYDGCNKSFSIHTDISDRTDSNSEQHEGDTQLGISGVPNLIKKNLQEARDRDHTELCDLSILPEMMRNKSGLIRNLTKNKDLGNYC